MLPIKLTVLPVLTVKVLGTVTVTYEPMSRFASSTTLFSVLLPVATNLAAVLLVIVPLLIVPLNVASPVSAVLPPLLLIDPDPVIVLPPAPLSVTLCAVTAAPTRTTPADSSDKLLAL